MTDHELDQLFAQARVETAADLGAAQRFLAGHRARLSRQRQVVRAGWVSALLASAAVITGVMVLRPAPDTVLPTSAAYEVYQSHLGEGW